MFLVCVSYDVYSWEHLIYQFGSYQHTISHVIKNGRIVHSRTTWYTQYYLRLDLEIGWHICILIFEDNFYAVVSSQACLTISVLPKLSMVTYVNTMHWTFIWCGYNTILCHLCIVVKHTNTAILVTELIVLTNILYCIWHITKISVLMLKIQENIQCMRNNFFFLNRTYIPLQSQNIHNKTGNTGRHTVHYLLARAVTNLIWIHWLHCFEMSKYYKFSFTSFS